MSELRNELSMIGQWEIFIAPGRREFVGQSDSAALARNRRFLDFVRNDRLSVDQSQHSFSCIDT
jgi:hypothetical protein